MTTSHFTGTEKGKQISIRKQQIIIAVRILQQLLL